MSRDLAAIGHAPEPQIMVVGARHRARAIGREAHRVDFVLMPFEPVQQLAPSRGRRLIPASQMMAVLSPLPEISLLPSGEKARPMTAFACPFSSATSLPLAKS